MIRESAGIKWVCFHDVGDNEYAVRKEDISTLYTYKDIVLSTNKIFYFITMLGGIVASISKEVYEEVKKDVGL
jgi:hypothetical protein